MTVPHEVAGLEEAVVNIRSVALGIAAGLFVGSVGWDYAGVEAATPDVPDRRGIEGTLPQSKVDEYAPDIRQFKSLTAEERRDRNMRRKLRRVDELIANGEYKKGESLLKSLRGINDPQIHNTFGFIYSQSDQPEKAIRHYEMALKASGARPTVEISARRQLAGLYFEQGREQVWEEDAAPLYRRALSSMQAWMELVPDPEPQDYLFLARIQLELDDLEGGIENLNTAIRMASERGGPVATEWTDMLDRMKSAQRNREVR